MGEYAILKGHEEAVFDVSFCPDGTNIMASASMDKTVRVWDIQSGKELIKFIGHSAAV